MNDVDALARGVRASDRRSVARAITLVESRRPDDAARALALLRALALEPRRGLRIGVSGPPGVGKSSLLEALGVYLIGRGFRPFVLVIDPSSRRVGGSILGDKTRMAELARSPRAFVRPSPSGDAAGGISHAAGDVLAVAEAAGFGPAFVETVGVGQAELAVLDVVDLLLLLLEPGAGDELQGIKRGLNEWADVVAVTKADAGRAELARRTSAEFDAAFRLLRGRDAPRVLSVSAHAGSGVADLWSALDERHRALEASGELVRRRAEQRKAELHRRLSEALLRRFMQQPGRAAALQRAEERVASGAELAAEAVWQLLDGSAG